MRPVVIVITLAAFCLHALCGCCAHHAHADEGATCGEAEHGGDHACTHEHDHDDTSMNAAHVEQVQAPLDSHESCPQGDCHFVLEAKSPLVQLNLAAAVAVAAMGGAITADLATVVTQTRAASESDGAPHVPLYLLHQVFLT